MQNHRRALTRHSRDEIITAPSFEKLASRVIAPTVDIEVQRPNLFPDLTDRLRGTAIRPAVCAALIGQDEN